MVHIDLGMRIVLCSIIELLMILTACHDLSFSFADRVVIITGGSAGIGATAAA